MWTIHGETFQTREDMVRRLAEIDAAHAGRAIDPKSPAGRLWEGLNAELDESQPAMRADRVATLTREQQMANLRTIAARGGGNLEGEAEAIAASGKRRTTVPGNATLSRALATVETYTRSGTLSARAADRLDAHLRTNDRHALDAAYITAIGSEHYFRAFGKILADPTTGHLRFTPEETAAFQAVVKADAERAPMAEGAPGTGGFAVPIQLDPTVMMSSSGTLNPIRQHARVITVGTNKWTGVSSDSVVASYDNEAEEVSDDSPTLAGPSIDIFMGRAFVPFSMELQDDWPALAGELATLIADGRDGLDATAMLTGSGTGEPSGVLDGLTAAEKVETAGAGLFAYSDVWKLREAIPPRWKATSTWAANSDLLDKVFQFVGVGDEAQAALYGQGREGLLIGKPTIEWSTMSASILAGEKIAIYGDFRAGFTIADRIGLSIEVVPHLFGAARRFPTGERGIFARWRCGSAVVNRNALRYLEIKA